MIFTLTNDRFPAGTVVGAYPQSEWPGGGAPPPTQGPRAVAEGFATVSASGIAVFHALDADTTFWAVAQVNGDWRWVRFRTAPTDGALYQTTDPEDLPYEIDVPANQTESVFRIKKGGATIFEIDAGGHLTAGIAAKVFVNAKDYGAIGDGASHPLSDFYPTLAAAQVVFPHAQSLTQQIDGIAIQAAINAASTAGGGTVFIPHGTYVVSYGTATITITGYHALKYALVIKTGVSLLGEGKGVTTLQNPAGPYDNTGRGFIMNEGGGRSSYFSIRDMTIDGNSAGSGIAGTDREYEVVGIFFGPCTDFEIANVESKGWQGKNIHLVGETGGLGRSPQRWSIHHSYFHHSNSNAIGFSQPGDEGMYDYTIHNNVIQNNIRGILGGEAEQGAEAIISEISSIVGRYVIAHNQIRSWGTISLSGSDGYCIGNYVDSHANSPGLVIGVGRISRVRFIGNVIDASNNTGLPAMRCADSGSSDTLIEGNIFIRPAVGSNATSAISFLGHSGERHTNLVIRNNTFKGGNALISDILVSEVDGLEITGNTCTDPASTTVANGAITVTSTCTAAIVSGNRTSYKFVDVQAPGAVVSGNRVEGPDFNTQALRVRGGKSAITGNRIKGYQTGGGNVGCVFIDSTYNTFVGNTVENVNTSKKWIQEGATADFNNYGDNTFIDAGTGTISTTGTNSRFRGNIGYVTSSSGNSSVANGGTIAHGLATTPSRVTVTSRVAKRIVSVTARGGTTFTVGVYDDTGTAVAGAETLDWSAEV